MNQLIFKCRTITSLAMYGSKGDEPDLRAPGIKASLRFWWRALHGHLSLEQLMEREGEIFGNTKGRSKIIIRVDQSFIKSVERTALLPHKPDKKVQNISSVIKKDCEFKVVIDHDTTVITQDELKNLFVIACTLGGWGKRARRGFGSIEVIEINGAPYTSPVNLKGLQDCLEIVVPGCYRNTVSQIESTTITKTTVDTYPKLWKIKIGKNIKKLEDIGKSTHVTKGENKIGYGASVGNGGNSRLASPVYISILPDGKPVISFLKKGGLTNYKIQDSLADKILS